MRFPRRRGRLLLLFSACFLGQAGIAFAADLTLQPLRDNFGGVGLIDMPSARMAPDGELSAGASFLQNIQHYDFSMQVTPWLAASFRYSGLQNFLASYPTYYDRSFAIKARLWDEGEFLPSVTLGINDLVGTGVYDAEYIVASKQFDDFDATLGLGWGRYGSTDLFRNPLEQISKSFATRPTFTAAGGTNFDVFLHGPGVGLFGGLSWRTPIKGLTAVVEYSSDRYTVETARGTFKPRNQMNFGVSYRAAPHVALGLNYMYGTALSGSITFELDPTVQQYSEKLGPELPDVSIRSAAEQQQALAVLVRKTPTPAPNLAVTALHTKNMLVDALWTPQSGVEDVEVQGRSLVIRTGRQSHFNCPTAADLIRNYDVGIDTVVIMQASKRANCKTGEISSTQALSMHPAMRGDGMLRNASVIDASGPALADAQGAKQKIYRTAAQQNLQIEAMTLSGAEVTLYYRNSEYQNESDAVDRLTRILMNDAPTDIERFRLISIVKGIPQTEFTVLRGSEERAFVQNNRLDISGATTILQPAPLLSATEQAAIAHPSFSWSVFPQIREQLFDPSDPLAVQFLLGADATLELFPGLSLTGEAEASVYDNFSTLRVPNSVLPHVRTDFVKYFSEGKNGIGDLEADYRFKLAPNVFAIAKVGYLESMFGGAGGEVLWRPEAQRWALGADAYEVWQRNFDRQFGLQPYHVFTGHISLYYDSPWYDLNFAMHAGQYLAGDLGLTFDVTRRFSTGVEIGVFMTKTNVSTQRLGEGSIDKGIIIRIPLGWALPIESQHALNMDVRPVLRDGGQQLSGDTTLYDETRRDSYGEILRSAPGALEQ